MSVTATNLLVDPANNLFLSMATLWGLAIKVGLKKLTLSSPFAVLLARAITGYGLVVLPITVADCTEYESLPFPLPQHRDPFDHVIITHARRHGLSVIGSDQRASTPTV